jgi:hypothetical protein
MKSNFLFSIFLSILLLSGFFTPAQALPDVLSVTGVSPSTAPNNVSTVLNITGTDFVTGAVVSLNGYGALATTYVSAVALTAALPAGVPVGIYTVVVTLPDTTQASLPNALTVIAPPVPTTAPPPTAVEATPIATDLPSGTYERPLIVVLTYSTSSSIIAMGQDFDLYVTIYNSGQHYARNIVASFTPGDIVPRKTGGVVSVSEIAPGNRADITQPLTAGTDLWGLSTASLLMTLSYTDVEGVAYSGTFNLSIPLSPPKVGAPTATPTPTPTATLPPILRPQLVISKYVTSIDPLQPGVQFELNLQVQNVGNELAKRVTMIVGGGSASSSSLTPEPGGISGASGEFTNFAPIGSSNVQSLGDLPAGQSISVSQPLIVNTTTNPGAYPMRISFTYLNEKGFVITDEQVITLLVYLVPNVEINFYREPDPFFVGQPGLLPLQVVNLGRRSVVLGNLKVNAPEAEAMGIMFSNNVILVGNLDIGMYFTLDATVIPAAPGPLELFLTVDYTDDFNRSQVISRTITVDVQEMIVPDSGMEGVGAPGIPVEQPETLWQKILRFLKGLFGLGSDRPTTESPVEVPAEGVITNEGSQSSPPLKGP